MALKTDTLKRGTKKAAVATNLFSQAQAQLSHSNDLLDVAIADDESQIADLQARIASATAQKKANDKVAAKLSDFIV